MKVEEIQIDKNEIVSNLDIEKLESTAITALATL